MDGQTDKILSVYKPPIYRSPMYKPTKKCLRTNISPGLYSEVYDMLFTIFGRSVQEHIFCTRPWGNIFPVRTSQPIDLFFMLGPTIFVLYLYSFIN